MKPSPPRLLLFLLATACAAGLAGCASTVQSRIASNPQLYDGLSGSHKGLVSHGKISEGMTKDAVYLAWGRPSSQKTSSSNGRVTETWLYTGSYPEYIGGYGGYGLPYYGYGHGYGHGYHHGYYCPSPRYYYRSYVAGKVTFSGNKVTQWEVSRP